MQNHRLNVSVVSLFACLLLFISACKTTESARSAATTEPVIAADMPVDEALKAAINGTGNTVEKVRQLIERRRESAGAAAALEQAITSNLLHYTNAQLINAASLYQVVSPRLSANLFAAMLNSGRPLARQIGWQMAATLPSSEIAAAIDRILSRAVIDNTEEDVLMPQMAQAVQANRLSSAFTLLRQGLMADGDEAYAKAMIALNPYQASNEFMAYLALAPLEELRQLTQKSVNIYTCMVILRHLTVYPVATAHPNYDQLFLYAVSRNNALAELANMVLLNSFPKYRESMAMILARLPTWIQIAYLEHARRNMSPEVSQFLVALRQVSSQSQVLEEIGEIQR